MQDCGMLRKQTPGNNSSNSISLKTLAEHLQLSPGIVSVVLNESPSASSIPATTKDRILAAAQKYNYRPNFFARTLRKKRSLTIGILIQDIGGGYGSLVVSGIESGLREGGYLYLLASHGHQTNVLEEYTQLFLERGIEGMIVVDTFLEKPLPLPTVAISGHRRLKGVTNIVLDHNKAAEVALKHLASLGHKNIAFMKGQTFSSDSEVRWKSICLVARKLGIQVRPELSIQLEAETSSPELGYPSVKRLLSHNRDFTALFAYNDISAIGAIRALTDAGLRVPQDVSVVGFDDIQTAAFHNPSLTTVRQPLSKMGELGAKTLLDRLKGDDKDYPVEIAVEPELIVRESSAPAASRTTAALPRTQLRAAK